MKYADIEAWAKAYYQSLNYKPMPVFNPGPASDPIVQKAGAGRLIFLTVGGGPGFNTEGAYDAVFVNVRIIGRQMQYDDAEQMAIDLDNGLTALDHNGVMGSAKYTSVVRQGGRPQMLLLDAANRYHFTGGYIIDVQTERQ